MTKLIGRFARLNLGFVLYALGIVLTIQANIGYAPWDVFHAGFSQTTGLSFGISSIIIGIAIIATVCLFKEKIGIGTVLNMVLIGIYIDLLQHFKIIPQSSNIYMGLLEMTAGLFVISLASYFYIGAGFGAGPRDSLMVLLMRIFKLPAGAIRTIIELTVICIGWLLGGKAGFGTVYSSVAIGFFIQSTFRMLKFNPTQVKHQTLPETIKVIKSLKSQQT